MCAMIPSIGPSAARPAPKPVDPPAASPVDRVQLGSTPASVDYQKAVKLVLSRAPSEVSKTWGKAGSVIGSPTRGSDGTVYVSLSYPAGLHAYDPETGGDRWGKLPPF